MDNPLSHVEHRLLNPDTYVRESTMIPLRNSDDDFSVFTDSRGQRQVHGQNDHQFSNNRIWG